MHELDTDGHDSAPAATVDRLRPGERSASWGYVLLLAGVALGLVGSLLYALTWQPAGIEAPAPAVECPEPPCGVSLDEMRTAPVLLLVPLLLQLLALALGVPDLVAAGWHLVRGRARTAGRRVLVFAGPALVLVGMEVVPHVLNPCLAGALFDVAVPGLCEGAAGGDVHDRWHALHHALVGAVPMTLLYRLSLHRWRPRTARV